MEAHLRLARGASLEAGRLAGQRLEGRRRRTRAGLEGRRRLASSLGGLAVVVQLVEILVLLRLVASLVHEVWFKESTIWGRVCVREAKSEC